LLLAESGATTGNGAVPESSYAFAAAATVAR